MLQTRRSAPFEFKKKTKTAGHLQLTVKCLVPVVCVAVAPPVTVEFYTALMLTITFFWVVMLNAGPTVPDVSRETSLICEVFGVFLSQPNTPEPHSPYQMSSHLVRLADPSINSHCITLCDRMTSGQWIRAKCQYVLLAQFEIQTRCFPGWAGEYHTNVSNGNCYVV